MTRTPRVREEGRLSPRPHKNGVKKCRSNFLCLSYIRIPIVLDVSIRILTEVELLFIVLATALYVGIVAICWTRAGLSDLRVQCACDLERDERPDNTNGSGTAPAVHGYRTSPEASRKVPDTEGAV
jgi:hypothetical protein